MNGTDASLPLPPPRRGWWRRNGRWALPVGCLSVLLSCGCLGALLVGLGVRAFDGAEVYFAAVERAKESPEVQAALGTPLHAGFELEALRVKRSGEVAFRTPLRGPDGEGTLVVDARRDPHGEGWDYQRLEVELEGAPPVDLLHAGRRRAPLPPGTLPFGHPPVPPDPDTPRMEERGPPPPPGDDADDPRTPDIEL